MTQLTTPTTPTTLATQPELEAAFAEFLRLNVAQGDASPKTISSYLTEVGQYTAWCEAEQIRPARATEADLMAYRRHLIESDYTRGTVATKLAVIRRFYEAATWRGLRPDNPAAGLKAPREKSAREDRIKFLPLEGFKQLLDLPEDGSPAGIRDRAILALLGYHGLRVAEVAGLELEDLELEADPPRMSVTGKGSKLRRVHLVGTSASALAAWLEVRPEVAESAVFLSLARNGPSGRLSTRALRYMVDGYLEQAGLKGAGISCHSLRHSFGTWSRFGGANLQAIAAEMGHASTTTTETYAKIVDRIRENPARYLEALLSGHT